MLGCSASSDGYTSQKINKNMEKVRNYVIHLSWSSVLICEIFLNVLDSIGQKGDNPACEIVHNILQRPRASRPLHIFLARKHIKENI